MAVASVRGTDPGDVARPLDDIGSGLDLEPINGAEVVPPQRPRTPGPAGTCLTYPALISGRSSDAPLPAVEHLISGPTAPLPHE